MVDRPAFTTTRLEEEKEDDKSKVIPLRLNLEELRMLEDDAKMLEQEKLSTVIKQLALIGHYAIHDQKTKLIIDTVFKNKRKNERIGIGVVNPVYTQM